MRKVCFLILSLCLLALLTLPAFAATGRVLDDAELLADNVEAELARELGTSAHGISYYVVTQRANSVISSMDVVRLCGIGNSEDAIVLVVRLSGSAYYYDMYIYNRPDDVFGQSDVNRVLDADEVYGIKSGKVAKGAQAFFRECELVMTEYEQAQERAAARKPLMTLIVAAVVGVLAGGGSVLGVFLYYRRKQHGESYPLDRYARLHLTDTYDRFVGSYVTRVRVQSNSSGGRGGGGGLSGGHRGGR